MPKISVIVPVYNTGDLVKECLISLFNQSFKDFEILIVNDGSVDGSEELIKDVIKGKQNCKYIYQDNRGLSSARNTGLENSSGKYIAFVDSDDWVEKEFLKSMISELEAYEADICECGYYRKKDNELVSKILPKDAYTEIIDENQFIEFYFRTFIENKYGIICCNKLYRRALIDELSLKFEENKEIYAEDLLFNTKYILSAKKIVEVSTPLYNYRIRDGSITQDSKPLLEKRYSELMNRIDPIVKKKLPKSYLNFLALMQYETINVISINSYNSIKDFDTVWKAIANYETANGQVFNRLKYLTSAKKSLKSIKKEYNIFFLFLSLAVKTKQTFILGFLYWLKISLASK